MIFTKMHGLRNDYVLIDAARHVLARPSELARRVCDSRSGVGADGLLLALPSRRADVRMRMFNPDGSEAEMCGNGIRCLGKFVYERGLVRRRELSVETLAGVRQLWLLGNGTRVERVRVDMGEPELSPRRIPVRLPGSLAVDIPLQVAGRRFRGTCVSMGNPHCVIFVDGLERFAVERYGPALEKHRVFPRHANVEFVEVVSRRELWQRTWERGAGETLACGTGACAAAVAGVLTGRTDRRVTNHLRGGALQIEWAKDGHVYATGPAEEVFQGTLLTV